MRNKRNRQRRPRLEGERLNELLDIAAELFISDGFQSASTNVIAQRASASKASLYSRFPTKEDLFLAVLDRRINRIFEAVKATIGTEASTRDTLVAFGEQILLPIFSDAQLALLRVVSMETTRFPQLGRRFFALGPERGISVLSNYMEAQIARGVLRGQDPRVMSQHFFGLIGGLPLLFRLLGTAKQFKTERQRKEHLEVSVDAFLAAYGNQSR
jgi:TetR/AcrR family transcriptional regulator, mexJK operon transcriptional repressor